jgi:hypothetical protein
MKTGMHRRATNGARGPFYGGAPSNNGMHPTADSAALIDNLRARTVESRRVMPGVRLLLDTVF